MQTAHRCDDHGDIIQWCGDHGVRKVLSEKVGLKGMEVPNEVVPRIIRYLKALEYIETVSNALQTIRDPKLTHDKNLAELRIMVFELERGLENSGNNSPPTDYHH